MLVIDSSSMVGSDSMVDSSDGYESEASFESKSAVGLGSALSVGSVLVTRDDSDSVRSATGECCRPAILQSTEGSFQHYGRWLHSMYTAHEGTPSNNAQIPHRCSTRLIHNLVLLLDL